MIQADLLGAEVERVGIIPGARVMCRGLPVPVTYQEQESMRVSSKPTLLWLLDEILEALRGGPVLRRDIFQHTRTCVEHATLGRHLHLLIDLGLARIDYRFDEPRDAGGSDPAVVELVEG